MKMRNYVFLFMLFCFSATISGQVSLVKDIDPGIGGGTDEFAPAGVFLGDHFIFPATTLENGNEVWITDGTEGGTVLLKDIRPGAASSQPSRFFSAFGKVYFVASTTAEGKELWVTDGTEDGTQMVMDIEPGATGSDPLFGAVYKDWLYFAATSQGDREIWRVDAQGTPELFLDLNASAQSKPRFFKVIGDKMYFAANEHPVDLSANDEDEPFVTDGTPGGTVKLIDVTIDNRGAGVRDFVGLGDNVFFGASTNGGASPGDHEIFITDGTSAGTSLLQDLLGSQWLTPYGSSVYFFYESALHRIQPNGSYFLVSSIHNDDAYHLPNPIVQFNDIMFIPAENASGSTGVELYTSKGGSGNTSILLDINPGSGSSYPADLVALEDRVLFVAASSDFDRELYVTDGTVDGTERVLDLNPGDNGSNPARLVAGEKVVYFYAFTPETGFELFKYDLEPSSTKPIATRQFQGNVFPLPATEGIVQVEWPVEDNWARGELFTAAGVGISTYENLEGNKLRISTGDLVPGVYFLNLISGRDRTMTRILIQ